LVAMSRADKITATIAIPISEIKMFLKYLLTCLDFVGNLFFHPKLNIAQENIVFKISKIITWIFSFLVKGPSFGVFFSVLSIK